MKKWFLIASFLLVSLSSFAKVNPRDFIFAIVKSEDVTYVFVNVKEHWETEGSLIDSYRSEEEDEYVHDQMLKADLCNSMESTFEPCKREYSKAQYVQMLESFGWKHDLKFENWMQTQM